MKEWKSCFLKEYILVHVKFAGFNFILFSNSILTAEHIQIGTSKILSECILILKAEMFSSVQLLSHVRLLETPWTAARQASLSITNSRSPPKPMSMELVMPSSHLILCCPPHLGFHGKWPKNVWSHHVLWFPMIFYFSLFN